MTSKIKGKPSFFLFLLIMAAFFAFSTYVRFPKDSYGYVNSDATYHVLLTMQAYDETSPSVHRFLPIQTFGDESNKWINNGPSLIQDKNGNNFYVSFSPLGFYAPYFFCKIFHLDLTANSIYLFNSMLMMICALFTGVIMYMIFKSLTIFWIAAFSYVCLPEMLFTQGIVYWHHSLAQVLLLIQTATFISIFVFKKTTWFFYLILAITCFLYPYLEWTGFVSNVGIALGMIVLNLGVEQDDDGRKRISLGVRTIVQIAAIGIITIAAAFYFVYRFTSIAPFDQVLSMLFSRAEARNEASFLTLLSGYFNSYSTILIAIAVLLVIVLAVKKSRMAFCSLFQNRTIFAIILVFVFPLVENIVLKEHAIMYTFDRLKASSVIIFLFCATVFALLKIAYSAIVLPIISILLFASFGLWQYNRKIIVMSQYSDTTALRDYLQDQYLLNKKGLLVRDGWRAWGHLQTMYHRNIYCTIIYGDSYLHDIANQGDYRYLVTLYATSGISDTCCYTLAWVRDLKENKSFIIKAANGEVKEVPPSEFYLTDGFWEKGYYRQSGGFFVLNTETNRTKYQSGGSVLLPDGSQRTITGTSVYDYYLNVYTEGEPFVSDLFPHQLEVIPKPTSFYLTDGNWERGYYRHSGGFFVENTKDNQERYSPGAYVQLPDGSRRQITNTAANGQYLNVYTDGGPFATDILPDQLEVVDDWASFYLTDDNWERGYLRQSGGFFVKNTESNRGKYTAGASVQLPDGSRRTITYTVESLDRYLNVYTDGEPFVADVFPHQLEVIPSTIQPAVDQ